MGAVSNMAAACCGGPRSWAWPVHLKGVGAAVGLALGGMQGMVAGEVPSKMMGLCEWEMPVHLMGGAHGKLASRAEVRVHLCDRHAMLVVVLV